MLSHVISGGGQRQYVLYTYVNGLPKEFIDWSSGYKFSEIQITYLDIPVNFKISDASNGITGSNVQYLFNGIVQNTPTYIPTTQATTIVLSATYRIDAATDTILAPEVEVSLSFPQQTKSIDPNVQAYYVLLDVPYEGGQADIKVLDYSKGYRFVIKTDIEKFITVTDETRYYRLFTKRLSSLDKPQCVFVAERGKSYTIIDNETLNQKNVTTSPDQSEEEKEVDLTKP